jgi:DNA-binding CsgD family transcriptional regulator/tetratricopeptide (TPR) repeat protein
MLRISGDRFAFRHELVREAILETLTPQQKRIIHRNALSALRASNDDLVDLGRLAHHAEGAGDADTVLEYAPLAARRARAVGASREAVAQLERALRFGDRLESSALADLLEEYSRACAAINEWELAIAADRRILEIWRREGNRLKEGWALTFLSGCLMSVGRNVEAEETNASAIEILEQFPPGRELADAYVGRASLRLVRRELTEAIEWGKKGLHLAEVTGDQRLLMEAHVGLGAALIVAGDAAGEQHLLRSIELARAEGEHWHVATGYSMLGAALTEMHAFERAEAFLAEGLAYAAENEMESSQITMNSTRALALFHLGRWPEAEESVREALARSRAGSVRRIGALTLLGRLKLRRGEEGAAECLEDALEIASAAPTLQRLTRVRAARAEAAWLAGELDRIRAEVHSVLPGTLEQRLPWFAGELLSWMARAGEEVEVPDWIPRPYALQVAGDWQSAATEWQRLGCVYEAALAEAETGEVEALQRALATFRALGAEPAARSTARRLRVLGVRDIPRGPRPSTRGNAANLTRRQVEILRLLAEGLTNSDIAGRLFLSPKTAGHHVSAVLRKLGAHSRTEAVHEATRLGLLGDADASRV